MTERRSALSFDARLRAFLAVAESGSFTEAAERLGVSQPSISQHIRQLEQVLGTPLVRRHGRGVSLTDAGRRLRQRVQPAYASIDAAIAELSQELGVVSGVVRVATVHTISKYFLAPVLADFSVQRPEATLRVLERGSADVADLVERGMADLGVVYDALAIGKHLQATPIFDERMALIHSPRLPPVERDGLAVVTAQTPLIGFPQGYAIRALLERRYGAELRIVAEVETVDTALRLVKAGTGYAILPESLPAELVEAIGLLRRPLEPPVPTRRVVVIHRTDQALTPLVEFMRERIVAAAGRTGPE